MTVLEDLVKNGVAEMSYELWEKVNPSLAGHNVQVEHVSLDKSPARFLKVYHNRPCKECGDVIYAAKI